MFGTRITKRAAIIVGCTLLAAGTAAAAASGSIPTPFSNDHGSSASVVTVDPSVSNSLETSIDDKAVGATDSSVDDSAAATDSWLAEEAALCAAASTSTSDASTTSDATSNSMDDQLAHDAESHGKSVDDFCTEVENELGDDNGVDATGSSIDDHGNDNDNGNDSATGSSVEGNGSGGHGADDTKTSVSTSNSVTGSSVDDNSQGGGSKGGSGGTSHP